MSSLKLPEEGGHAQPPQRRVRLGGVGAAIAGPGSGGAASPLLCRPPEALAAAMPPSLSSSVPLRPWQQECCFPSRLRSP